MEIEITNIIVLETNGTDVVFVHTNLPSPFPSEFSSQNLMFKFDVSKGSGAQYVKNNFNIEPEVINVE